MSGYVTKAFLQNLRTGEQRRFQFNPTEFSTNESVTFEEIKSPGMSYPIFQYVGGEVSEITFTIFLDGQLGNSTIDSWLYFLDSFFPPKDQGTQFVPPPVALFAYGSFVRQGVISDKKYNPTMFDSMLYPIRATIDLTIKIIQ